MVRLARAAAVIAATLLSAVVVAAAPIRDGNLEVHWPEGNVLLAGAPHDPESLEPDYNAVVTIEATQA